MLALVIFSLLLINAESRHPARIVGGSDAPEGKYPYQVSFRTGLGHFCSGSIIDSHWILTAAHCFDGVDAGAVTVSAGTNYLDKRGQEYKVQFYVLHEKYKSFFHDDIALVRVVGEIEFNDHVKPIQLPQNDFDADFVPASFAGWGSTQLGGSSPNNMQEIDLFVISNARCSVRYSITSNHICTFTREFEGICHGDSGGPLTVKGYQVGIASYVTPCAAGEPDVYTRVFKYLDWIERTKERLDYVFLS